MADARFERADFHGHPLLHPPYDRKFGLERYTTISLERGITLPPTTDFGIEGRFQGFYEDAVPRSWDKQRFEHGFVVYDEFGNRTIYFFSEEVPTRDGHLLLVGLEKPVQAGMPLEDTLTEAEDQGAIIVADHALIPGIRGGLGKEQVVKYRERLHALESNAQVTNMFGRFSFGIFRQRPNNEAIYELGRELGLPVVACSDFHMAYIGWLPFFNGKASLRKDYGATYTEFRPLGDNNSAWRDDVKEIVRAHNFEITHRYAGGLTNFRWQLPSMLLSLAYATGMRKRRPD